MSPSPRIECSFGDSWKSLSGDGRLTQRHVIRIAPHFATRIATLRSSLLIVMEFTLRCSCGPPATGSAQGAPRSHKDDARADGSPTDASVARIRPVAGVQKEVTMQLPRTPIELNEQFPQEARCCRYLRRRESEENAAPCSPPSSATVSSVPAHTDDLVEAGLLGFVAGVFGDGGASAGTGRGRGRGSPRSLTGRGAVGTGWTAIRRGGQSALGRIDRRCAAGPWGREARPSHPDASVVFPCCDDG